jgi:hypothetical protein
MLIHRHKSLAFDGCNLLFGCDIVANINHISSVDEHDQPNAGRERGKQPFRYMRPNIVRYIFPDPTGWVVKVFLVPVDRPAPAMYEWILAWCLVIFRRAHETRNIQPENR